MKKRFPEYFKLTSSEIDKLWKTGIFVLDANILLNLYRYSNETRIEYFKILKKLKRRIWIPYQAGFEFFENRLNVIKSQEKSYLDAILSLETIRNEFENKRQHPFIENTLFEKFTKLNSEVIDELKTNQEVLNDRILDDEILKELTQLLDNNIGEEPNDELMKELLKEGALRFEKRIPPGFKDNSKDKNVPNSNKRFGDFIVWKQILNRASKDNASIILVTDDKKEDWWVRLKGKTLQPRPELLKEFCEQSNGLFHMYQSDRFLEFASSYLNEKIEPKTIEEIRQLRREDEQKRIKSLRDKIRIQTEKKELLLKEFNQTKEELLEIIFLRGGLMHDIRKLEEDESKTDKAEELENLNFKLNEVAKLQQTYIKKLADQSKVLEKMTKK